MIYKEKKQKLISENFKKFITLFYLRNYFLTDQNSNFDIKPTKDFNEITKLIKSFAHSNNMSLYFVYLPDFARYELELSPKNIQIIKNIIEKNQIKFLNIHEVVFKNLKNPKSLFPFDNNGHYNERGYELVSKAIFKFIIN